MTKKQGFVGLDGNWIKPPDMNGLRYENDYYYSAEVNDSLILLRLNSKENSFDVVNYKLGEHKLFYSNLAIIKKSNGDRGIINAETNKMALHFEYTFLIEDGGVFVVRNKDDKWGVYDKNMKQMVPEIYSDIDVDEGKILTTIKANGKSDKDEIFNLKGVKLKNEN